MRYIEVCKLSVGVYVWAGIVVCLSIVALWWTGPLSYDSWERLHYPNCCVNLRLLFFFKGRDRYRWETHPLPQTMKKETGTTVVCFGENCRYQTFQWALPKKEVIDWLIFSRRWSQGLNRLLKEPEQLINAILDVSQLHSHVCFLHPSHLSHHPGSASEPTWHNWNLLRLLFPLCLRNF